MIRSIVPAESPPSSQLPAAAGCSPDELGAVQGMLDEYHATHAGNGHRILSYDGCDALVGLVYFAPRQFADRV